MSRMHIGHYQLLVLSPAGNPRIVQHIDDGFRQQLTQLYREKLPRDGVILDLMSSWVSHLPEDGAYSQVVGHGMNAQVCAIGTAVLYPADWCAE